MLAELRVRNFAVIEKAELSFGPGLNVLSGETGAGKTIIMTALNLLIGGRASPELVRTGAKEAVVEGTFELEGESPSGGATEWLNADNPRELLVRRVIAEGGRSRAALNDNTVTVQSLARIGAALVQIYGQHEQQTLLVRENHLSILDRHAGLEAQVEEYRTHYRQALEIRERLSELTRRERDRSELLELARFRLAELERANLAPGEDAALGETRTVLANAAKLGEAADSAEQMLYGGDAAIIDAVSRAHARLLDAAAIDPKLNEASELIETARANLEEAARSLRAYADRIEADPARLEEIEARLQELTRLKRKYGGSIESALDTLERSRAEIAELESAGEDRAAAEREFNALLEDLFARADSLSAARRENASELKLRIEGELKTLGMRNASFETHFEHADENESSILANGRALGPAGFDSVEFYIAPNLGQPAMPLARIASGGELSRVMLALKRLEAQRRGVATLIFDEVDAGIGGAVAEIVGRKLKQLAKFHQVLCVTHLPQIAAFADSHFVVEKEERRGSTRSRVIALELSDRPGEIARMIGGDGSSGKLLHAARELLQRARA